MEINPQEEICDFGRHKDQPYTKIPASYLLWMVRAAHRCANIAEAELERRGTVIPEMDITGHAVNRASQHLLDRWQRDTALSHEGLWNWLHSKANTALERRVTDAQGRYIYDGITFVFDFDGGWPVLKTVWSGNQPLYQREETGIGRAHPQDIGELF